MAAHLEEGSEADQEQLVTLHDHCSLWLPWEGQKKEKDPSEEQSLQDLCVVFFFLCFIVAALLLFLFFGLIFGDWTVTAPDPVSHCYLHLHVKM